MTDTPTTSSDASTGSAPAPRKRGNALGGKVLAELKEIAAELKIDGASAMRKGQLIDAIKAARGETPTAPPQQSAPVQPAGEEAASAPGRGRGARRAAGPANDADAGAQRPAEQSRDNQQDAGTDDARPAKGGKNAGQDGEGSKAQKSKGQDKAQGKDQGKDQAAKGQDPKGQDKSGDAKGQDSSTRQERGDKAAKGQGGDDRGGADNRQGKGGRGGNGNGNGGNGNGNGGKGARDTAQRGNDADQRGGDARDDDRDDEGGGRRRNRRGRNRGSRGPDGEPTYTEDDVLVPAAGILDILDNYAFVRTTGYLPSENDVYLSLSMVRKLGLRKGDAVTGQVRQPREGERKEKFNPMVRIDTVNGATAEESRTRPEFSTLTPLFPTERLRLETDAASLTTRVVDVVAPVGKGQRGLVVAPPRAGSTTTLRAVADAVTTNNPECHLMVVLIDERPEEVTEMQRSIKGEVIASTFDRPASDHTTVAELAIERAKRLVELGHDVVVLLDSVTRLGRAYHQTAPSSGRGAGGFVDSAALHPVKRFFGAARNIEDGGSLTILATALVETGSRTDEAVLEELSGSATSELRLRREAADQRVFPAIDPRASSTRREELLLDDDELAATWALRRSLGDLDDQQALESVLERLRRAGTNAEFLRKVQASAQD